MTEEERRRLSEWGTPRLLHRDEVAAEQDRNERRFRRIVAQARQARP